MGPFEENLKAIFFSGQHTLIQTSKPNGAIVAMRESIANIDAYLDFQSCYQSGHEVFASTKLTTDALDYRTAFFKFQDGIFVLGKLKDNTGQFNDDVVYAAYFGGSSNQSNVIFAQIPKKQSFYAGIGRETDSAYITIASKKPWRQLDFENGIVYKCTAKAHHTAHPDISRIQTEDELPEIDFSAKLCDEATQLKKTCEEISTKRRFIFVRGELRLQ